MDAALGVLLLAVYIVGVVGLASAITYGVIRIFPTERKPKSDAEPETPTEKNGETSAGSLFRRSKRGKT